MNRIVIGFGLFLTSLPVAFAQTVTYRIINDRETLSCFHAQPSTQTFARAAPPDEVFSVSASMNAYNQQDDYDEWSNVEHSSLFDQNGANVFHEGYCSAESLLRMARGTFGGQTTFEVTVDAPIGAFIDAGTSGGMWQNGFATATRLNWVHLEVNGIRRAQAGSFPGHEPGFHLEWVLMPGTTYTFRVGGLARADVTQGGDAYSFYTTVLNIMFVPSFIIGDA